jgi:hypothetical protein
MLPFLAEISTMRWQASGAIIARRKPDGETLELVRLGSHSELGL